MSLNKSEKVFLTGEITSIIFNNPENGYSVLSLTPCGDDAPDSALCKGIFENTMRDDITAVGGVPSPVIGQTLKMEGVWTKHPSYGSQFKIASCKVVLPVSRRGMIAYLGSGMIKGIGYVTAERIVDAFGSETFNILDNSPLALRNVSGIGPKKSDSVISSWKEHRQIHKTVSFLYDHGVGLSYAMKIYKAYREKTIDILCENPYRICSEIDGIGFLTADNIAMSMGFPVDSPLRINSAMSYLISYYCNSSGNIYVNLDSLLYNAQKLMSKIKINPLEINETELRVSLNSLSAAREILMVEKDGGIFITVPSLYESEKTAAELLGKMCAVSYTPIDRKKAFEAAEKAEKECGITLSDSQKEALLSVMHSNVSVVTGGPGTGKTTLIKSIVKACKKIGFRNPLLAAPTGRAAKRISDGTGYDASTIHRMLEYNGISGFAIDERNKLNTDLLIIDESSMVDTLLFSALLKAIPSNAKLVLVGDINQLPSVGPGNVLKDIIDSRCCNVRMLNFVFRQGKGSDISLCAQQINQSQFPTPSKKRGSEFVFIEAEDSSSAVNIVSELYTKTIPKKYKLDPLFDIQIITPMHKGTTGTENLNECLGKICSGCYDREAHKVPEITRFGKTFKVGDKIMQIKNDYDKEVFNGDVGIIDSINYEMSYVVVRIESSRIHYDFSELDQITHAYAVTVHKSQGCEYPAVIIPLFDENSIMLQKNLLYTAVTRGKKHVYLVGTKSAVNTALRNTKTTERKTFLKERLQGKNIRRIFNISDVLEASDMRER